ncbi:MAG: hypothetical protein ABI868_12570 [Acidobacteriota bacterium]
MKRVRMFTLLTLLACLAVAATAAAQFGHPLKGTWSGDWGPDKNNRTHLLIEIKWDGKALTGTLNPGPDAAPLQNLTVNPESWIVHFEADAKDASGKAVRSIVDGKVENLGAYDRIITGTWSQASTKGDFKITMN